MRLLALATLALLGCGRFGFDALGDDGFDPESGPDGGGGATDGDATADPDAAALTACSDPACKEQRLVDGAMFLRNGDMWYPATTSPFFLERYEVTVARFREFVAQGYGTQVRPPTSWAGEHPDVEGSGWRPSWNTQLALSTTDLVDRVTQHSIYTANPGANEQMPVVGITWYEAFAFCIWDGGRLPTVAEHEAAAFGGSEQRLYPWGPTYSPTLVATGVLQRVGSHSPAGDARWGHTDLVGNADEWALDYFGSLPQPCNDCANLQPETTPTRILLGGDYAAPANELAQTALLHGMGPAQRLPTVGFRCARPGA